MEEMKDSTVISNVVRLLYRAPYCNILMMGRFRGNIEINQLKMVLEQCTEKYPLLRTAIKQDTSGNAGFYFNNISSIEVIQFNKNNDNEWIDLAWKEQKKPFDLSNGPLVKFLLLNSSENSDIVVICHHAISDGLSLVYLIKYIAQLLENKVLASEPFPVPPSLMMNNLKVKTLPDIITIAFIYLLNRLWNNNKTIFTDNDYENLYNQYWESRNINILQLNISEKITKALIDQCHKKNVTVNSAIITAIALAQYDLQGKAESYLKKGLLAINIRNLFIENPGENMGCLALGTQINLPGRDTFWNSAIKFNRKIKKLLFNPKEYLKFFAPLDYIEPSLLDSIYFTAHGTFKNKISNILKNIIMTRNDKPKRSLDITNLGAINTDDTAILETVQFIPILSMNYEKTIGIITTKSKMNLVIMHDSLQTNPVLIENFRLKILDYINLAIKE